MCTNGIRNPRLCYFGILCGHVWIWDACHLASAAHPQMTLTVTIYISLTLFTLGLTIGALLAKPTSKTLSWINWPLATLMALGTLALVLPLPQGLPVEQILQVSAVTSTSTGLAGGCAAMARSHRMNEANGSVAHTTAAHASGMRSMGILTLLPMK